MGCFTAFRTVLVFTRDLPGVGNLALEIGAGLWVSRTGERGQESPQGALQEVRSEDSLGGCSSPERPPWRPSCQENDGRWVDQRPPFLTRQQALLRPSLGMWGIFSTLRFLLPNVRSVREDNTRRDCSSECGTWWTFNKQQTYQGWWSSEPVLGYTEEQGPQRCPPPNLQLLSLF